MRVRTQQLEKNTTHKMSRCHCRVIFPDTMTHIRILLEYFSRTDFPSCMITDVACTRPHRNTEGSPHHPIPNDPCTCILELRIIFYMGHPLPPSPSMRKWHTRPWVHLPLWSYVYGIQDLRYPFTPGNGKWVYFTPLTIDWTVRNVLRSEYCSI